MTLSAKLIRCLVLASCTAVSACALSDADCCPGDWNYIAQIHVCCPLHYVYDEERDSCKCDDSKGWVVGDDNITCVQAPPPSTESTDLEGSNPGATDTVPTRASGLGKACVDKDNSTDCADYCEDLCAWNPIAGAGYCTTQGCGAEMACASGYTCCDCTKSSVLPQVNACLKDADASLAGSLGGCTCS